jgi:hypothetical protein
MKFQRTYIFAFKDQEVHSPVAILGILVMFVLVIYVALVIGSVFFVIALKFWYVVLPCVRYRTVRSLS